MLGLIRFTLCLCLATLIGCASNPYPPLTELEYDAPDLGNTDPRWPLVSESVYQTPAFALELEILFLEFQQLQRTKAEVRGPGYLERCFKLQQLAAVDSRTLQNYGPFATDVESCILTGHPERNRGNFVINITIPDLPPMLCGTFTLYTTGRRTEHQSEFNNRVVKRKYQEGRASVIERLDGLVGLLDLERLLLPAGDFQDEVDDFLCLSRQDGTLRVEAILPLEYDMTDYNLPYYSDHDPALQEAIVAAVNAGQDETQAEHWTQTRLTTSRDTIASCPSNPYLCGQDYTGPTMLHHIRLQDNGQTTGCFRVWALSVGRRLRNMDTVVHPVTNRDVFIRDIDCNSPEAPILDHASG